MVKTLERFLNAILPLRNGLLTLSGAGRVLVHTAFTEILMMTKLSARLLPWMLIPDQKLNRLEISRALLARYQSDPTNFLKVIVTQDQTWVHHLTLNQKIRASNGRMPFLLHQWNLKGCHLGVLMIDYLQQGRTING